MLSLKPPNPGFENEVSRDLERDIAMNYGKALRMARAAKGISQKELAERSGLGKSFLSLIEAGHRAPSVAALESLARALEIPLYLLVLLGSEENDLRGLSSEQAAQIGRQLLNLVLKSEFGRKS